MLEWHIFKGSHPDLTVGEMVRGALIPSPRLEASLFEPHSTTST